MHCGPCTTAPRAPTARASVRSAAAPAEAPAAAAAQRGGSAGARPRAYRCACGGTCPRCAGRYATAPAAALPADLRAQMEGAFDTDFSDVRLQRDSATARGLGARALAQGSQLHFAPGAWAPGSATGRTLIAHELAHVVQQRAGRVRGQRLAGGVALNDDPVLEREADRLAERATWARPPTADGGSAWRAAAPALAPGGTAQRTPAPEVCPTPAGLACPTIPSEPSVVGTNVTYAQNAFTLTGPWRTQLDAMAAQWHADGARSFIRIDGYASAEGDCAFNWTLSCRRASTVVDELVHPSDGSAGIPSDRLDAFAHGESDVAGPALASNRRAAISLPPAPPAGVAAARGPDQRSAGAGAASQVPDTDLAREVGYEIDPSSRPAPAPPVTPPPVTPPGVTPPPPVLPPPPARVPWDGAPRDGTAAEATRAAAARRSMQTQLFTAYDAYLRHFRPTVTATLARPRVDFTAGATPSGARAPATGVVDIANGARSVLEMRYGVSMDAAASTSAQGYSRAVRRGAPAVDQNVFDPYSEADRRTLTASPDIAPGVAWWLFENDVPGAAGAAGSRSFATDILTQHRYSTQDAGAAQYRWDVANAYAGATTLSSPANRQQLVDYRLAQWNERGDLGITLLSAFDPGTDRNRAERAQRWEVFGTAVHESLHLRTHPTFSNAALGRGTMVEGFTEMFTVATLNTDVLPAVRAGGREGLRRTVEGVLATPAPDSTVITNHTTPTQYVAHRDAAERIRDGGTPTAGAAHGGIGEPGVRAAFFQGHVEYLGLKPDGTPLTGQPAAGAPLRLRVPAGIAGLNELAWRTGVPRARIEADNPGIASPLPADAVLDGCREHVVVASDTTHPRSALHESAAETRAQVATQNGVSEADLVRANPDIALDPVTNAWPPLSVGQRLLIPAH